MNSDQSIAAQITKLKALVDDKKVDFIFMGSYAPGRRDCDEADPRSGDQPADHRRSRLRRDLLARRCAEPEELLRRRRRRHDRRRSEQAAGSRLPRPTRRSTRQFAPLGEQTLSGYSAVYALRPCDPAGEVDGRGKDRRRAREVQERAAADREHHVDFEVPHLEATAACRSSPSSARRRSSSQRSRRGRASCRRHSASQLSRSGAGARADRRPGFSPRSAP